MSVRTKGQSQPGKKTTHAPGQYLGFSLQATRFLVKLLEADPDWSVSLEVFEDVGVEGPLGNRIAEQNKSTSNGNPVADHAVGLWKALSNWVNAVESGELELGNTLFEIYVSAPKTGRIVEGFSHARTISEAGTALEEAKRIIWGDAPEYLLKQRMPKSIAEYVSRVFDADPSSVSRIIMAFTYRSGTGSPQQELLSLLSKALIPTEFVDDVLLYSLGWVKQQIDILLEQKRPAVVSVERFRTSVTSFVQKLAYRSILNTYAKQPTREQIETDLQLRTYVRQLELIESDDIDKIRAVTDYLKASSDRTYWSEKGLIHESSFDEFEDGLNRTWKNLKSKFDILLSGKNEIERGQFLYSECSEHKSTLEGLELPYHFVPGSFHALADSEDIGWHPDYKSKLRDAPDKRG